MKATWNGGKEFFTLVFMHKSGHIFGIIFPAGMRGTGRSFSYVGMKCLVDGLADRTRHFTSSLDGKVGVLAVTVPREICNSKNRLAKQLNSKINGMYVWVNTIK